MRLLHMSVNNVGRAYNYDDTGKVTFAACPKHNSLSVNITMGQP